MKFTSKKVVSEVVIDLEDGCVLKLTKENVQDISMAGFDRCCWVVLINMSNGISAQIKVESDSELLNELTKLVLG